MRAGRAGRAWPCRAWMREFGIRSTRGQGDRGINASGTPLAFMPRKPLDAWSSAAHFEAVGGDGICIPTGCLTASAGSGAEPQECPSDSLAVCCVAIARAAHTPPNALFSGWVNFREQALMWCRLCALCAVRARELGQPSRAALLARANKDLLHVRELTSDFFVALAFFFVNWACMSVARTRSIVPP